MVSVRLREVVIDCPEGDPRPLVEFYRQLGGFTVAGQINPQNTLLESSVGFDLGVQPVKEPYGAPTWPSQERGQQMHFDFVTDDVPAAVALAESLGAVRLPSQVDDAGWVVLRDPAGHPFCIEERSERSLPVLEGLLVRLEAVCVDCADAAALSAFYAGWLGVEPLEGKRALPLGNGQILWFQEVDGYQPPTWPTQERGQQMHFDFTVSDLAAAGDVAAGLGATQVGGEPGTYTIFLDPAGHSFCISEY